MRKAIIQVSSYIALARCENVNGCWQVHGQRAMSIEYAIFFFLLLQLNPVDFGAHTSDDGANDHSGDYHPLEDWRESMDDDDRADNIEPINNEIVTENGDVETGEHSGADLVPQPFRVSLTIFSFKLYRVKTLITAKVVYFFLFTVSVIIVFALITIFNYKLQFLMIGFHDQLFTKWWQTIVKCFNLFLFFHDFIIFLLSN